MKRVIAVDTETFLFGPENLAPRLVCLTFAMRRDKVVRAYLTSNGDGDELYDDLVALFEPGHILVFHNAAYDLAVICEAFPDLEPMIWAKLEAGEITDTMIREMLLNLSTHGNIDNIDLEDGGSARIEYHLSDLVLTYTGEDISDTKTGDDIWRLNYDQLDGIAGRRYPKDAAQYAKDDASHTLVVYEEQCLQRSSAASYGSYDTAPFHVMAALALYFTSMRGMKVDGNRFYEMQAWLDEQLTPERLSLLIESGIMNPAIGEKVYSSQLVRASALLHSEKGVKLRKVKMVTRGKEKVVELARDKDMVKHREFLELHKIKFANAKASKINTAPLHEKILEVCESIGVKAKMTPKGGVSASDEVLERLAVHDEVLENYRHRAGLQKLVTTEMPRLQWPCFSGKPADVVHFKFSVLKVTGRTGSYGNNMNKAKKDPSCIAYPAAPGQQFHKKIRPCYKARKGFYLCSVDFSSLELVTTAQITKDLFGFSVHLDKLNMGYDLHGYLGSQLALNMSPEFVESCEAVDIDLDDADATYEHFMTLKKADADFFKWWRKFAKPVGLGYPGGLGPATFIDISGKAPYFVDMYVIAGERFENHPEEFDEADWAERLLRHGKKIHGWEDICDFEWTKVMKAFALAMRLKDIWLETYPEMVRYFEHVQAQKDVNNPVLRTIWDEDAQKEREIKGLCYTSPMGMHRAACIFTNAANGECMQTPGAEIAKQALIDVVKASRQLDHILFGCYVVDFIHDELLLELPCATTNDTVPEVQRLMSAAAQKHVLRDVGIGTEAVLMRNWRKEAEPVFDEEGNLTLWEPENEAIA